MNVDDTFARANAEIEALKKLKPKSDAEARKRAAELTQLNEVLIAAAKKVTDANAAKRVSNGSGAKADDRLISGDPRRTVTVGFLEEVLEAVAKGLRGWIDPILADIKKDIAELEARPSLKYEGVWDPERVYHVGEFVTEDGSLWHCADTCVGVRPPGSAWRLAVKRGRDGKASR